MTSGYDPRMRKTLNHLNLMSQVHKSRKRNPKNPDKKGFDSRRILW